MSAVAVPDPSRRRGRRPLSEEEIPGPMKPVEFEPPPRIYLEVSPGHYVQQWDQETRGQETAAAG